MEEQAIKLMTILSQAKKHINELESLMSEAKAVIADVEEFSEENKDKRFLLDLSNLDMDSVTISRLRQAKCHTVGDVLKMGRINLMKFRGISCKTIDKVRAAFENIGIDFR